MRKNSLFRLFLTGAITPMRRRIRGRGRRGTMVLATLGLAALGFPMLIHPAPRLVWNASASAPIGLYWVAGRAVSRGDFVFVDLPEDISRLAAERGYLPRAVPLVKRVVAMSGDLVCAVGDSVSVTDRVVAKRLVRDGQERPLPVWEGCRLIRLGEIFLLMEGVPDSFDSRYFGPISTSAIIGKLVPIWVF